MKKVILFSCLMTIFIGTSLSQGTQASGFSLPGLDVDSATKAKKSAIRMALLRDLENQRMSPTYLNKKLAHIGASLHIDDKFNIIDSLYAEADIYTLPFCGRYEKDTLLKAKLPLDRTFMENSNYVLGIFVPAGLPLSPPNSSSFYSTVRVVKKEDIKLLVLDEEQLKKMNLPKDAAAFICNIHLPKPFKNEYDKCTALCVLNKMGAPIWFHYFYKDMTEDEVFKLILSNLHMIQFDSKAKS